MNFDANGYITDAVQIPQLGPNPWAEMSQESQAALGQAQAGAAGIPRLAAGLNDARGTLQDFAQSTKPAPIDYPTLPNDYGLGRASQPAPAAAAAGSPWLLIGDALSR